MSAAAVVLGSSTFSLVPTSGVAAGPIHGRAVVLAASRLTKRPRSEAMNSLKRFFKVPQIVDDRERRGSYLNQLLTGGSPNDRAKAAGRTETGAPSLQQHTARDKGLHPFTASHQAMTSAVGSKGARELARGGRGACGELASAALASGCAADS